MHGTFKSCSYVEFPRHPWTSFRAPCKTILMKGVKSSNGKVFLYTKLSFCYMPFLPHIKMHVNQWKDRCVQGGLMADIYIMDKFGRSS